jgi:hypothetical protein
MKQYYRKQPFTNCPKFKHGVTKFAQVWPHDKLHFVPVVTSAECHEGCVEGSTAANILNLIPSEWSNSWPGRFPVRGQRLVVLNWIGG